jgi:hypothetical protein
MKMFGKHPRFPRYCDCSQFKRNSQLLSFPWYDDLDEIFGGQTAGGLKARLPSAEP